jgi:site-specific recombinase XerD
MNPDHALDRMTEVMRLKHYSPRTRETYTGWSRRYIGWLRPNLAHLQDQTSEKKVEAFLTALAQDNVSASTQNQAFNALLFFYAHGVGGPLEGTIQALRARRPKRTRIAPDPVVVQRVLSLVKDRHGYPIRLLCHLLYACGLRVSEVVNLRLRDLLIKDSLLVIREAKGNKDRKVTLPCSLLPAIERQMLIARATHAQDSANRLPIQLPHLLRKKYPAWQYAESWAWLFPQRDPCQDPDDQRTVRFHLHEANIQRSMADACKAANVTGLTPHHLRHAWATHAHRAGASLRDLQEHLGHNHLNTTMIYISPNPTPIPSPYDSLGLTL